MKIVRILLLYAIIATAELCSGYRILGLYPISKKSHFGVFDQLFYGLARKGHQIDLISVHPPKHSHPKYRHIMNITDSATSIYNNYDTVKHLQNNMAYFVAYIGYLRCKALGDPEFLALARNPPKDPPYDLIIMQMLNYHCFMILGHLWKIPVVLVSTGYLYPWMHDMIGNPENPSFAPHSMIPVEEGTDFWARFYNTHAFNYAKLNYLYHSRNQNELIQKYFGPDAPSIRELEQSASLVLINTYFSINGIKPMTTGLIEVGGIHIQNDGPDLPGKLKKWLDESKDGIIYFNLGSIYTLDIFPNETIKVILSSIQKLTPVRALMRIPKPEKMPMKIPDNVYPMSWIPQEKVLQHPNVRVFLTHGGLLGTQESIYYGVPMLCMPLVVDQWSNAHNYVEKKIAVKVDLGSITQEEFGSSLNEILNNHIYRENIKKYSSMFRDRPQSPLDTAMFWIEFVARNGKDSLRSPAMNLQWWQIALLDVFAVTIGGLFVFLYITIIIVKVIIRFLFYKKPDKIPKDKKQN